MKGITRVKNGWLARVYRNGGTISEYFYDKDFDGEAGSMNAAERHLQEFEKNNPKPVKKPEDRYSITEQKAVGGFGGMSRFWNVSYATSGKLKNKRFYFSNQDEREIKYNEACEFKKKMDE